MKNFEVANIHCENCAKTIKNALEEEFGEIKVDLGRQPRMVSLVLDDARVERFKAELADLGFDVIKEI